MSTPTNYEIVGIVVNLLFTLYIAGATVQYSAEIKFWVPGVVTSVLTLLLLFFGIQRLKLLNQMDFYNMSVMELQKRLIMFKQRYLRYKTIEFYMYPLFILAAIPILGMAMRHFDIYKHPYNFAIAVVLALILGYGATIWVCKNWYEKKIKNTVDFLKELERFENY